jgi:hypothetical protein
VAAGLALTAIALVKTAGAVVPLLVEAGLLRGRRWWRRTEWVGALLLVGYGAANMLGAWWQLSGIPKPPADLTATRGHAFLWDPLFCAWGLLLLLGLRSTAGDSADLIRQRPNG